MSDNPLLPSILVEKTHKTQKYNPLDFGDIVKQIILSLHHLCLDIFSFYE